MKNQEKPTKLLKNQTKTFKYFTFLALNSIIFER